METALKKSMPAIVKQIAQWFEITVSIRLFGVTVFSFTWPPKAEQENIEIKS